MREIETRVCLNVRPQSGMATNYGNFSFEETGSLRDAQEDKTAIQRAADADVLVHTTAMQRDSTQTPIQNQLVETYPVSPSLEMLGWSSS